MQEWRKRWIGLSSGKVSESAVHPAIDVNLVALVIIKTPQGGLVTTAQKIRGDPDGIVRTIKAVLMANRYLKQNKGEFFTKLLAKESGVHDPVVAGLIHEEIVKLYSDTGVVSDEAMQEFIANPKRR